MTSLPQTQQRTFTVQDGRRRTPPVASGAAGSSGAARSRGRQALPPIDPSKEYGCVDWFLYPDIATAEARSKRARA